MKHHRDNYKYIWETAHRLLVDKTGAGGETDVVEKLRSHLGTLERWNTLVENVDARVDECRSAVEQLKQYQVCLISQMYVDIESGI